MGDTGIIICGNRYDVDHKVVTFEDEGGFSAYVPHRTDNIAEVYAYDPAPGLKQRASRYRVRRLMGSSNSLTRLKQVVRQVVVHLDGCLSAKMCYHVLHNQRGLSVHFMVDNDGTIYQTLDLLHCAFHAGGVNEVSVGIELQNRGDAARYPNSYPEGRSTVTCRVHGHQFLCYDFTAAQYEAMVRLCRTMARVLDLPLVSPQDSGGRPVWTTIPSVRSFHGFIGHFHIIESKWDPGCWDFQRLLSRIGSSVTFPLSALARSTNGPSMEQQAERYFESSEQDAELHFPVGPLGQSRLWHGGVHLKGTEDTPIHAVMGGRVVAARMAPPCPVGSCNFVLLRHRISLGRTWTLYSLYYHLAWATESDEAAAQIPWIARARSTGTATALDRGEVSLLGVPTEAGEIIGMMGEGGPTGGREEQIHFAVFGAEELGASVDPGYWEVVDGSETSRFCDSRAILSLIDRPMGDKRPDGLLSRRELRNFYQLNNRRRQLRRLVVRHRSEWTPGDWDEQLQRAPDFAALPAAIRRRLVATQITPTLWWTPEVARHTGLPVNGVVYSYHPIGFLVWFATVATKFASQRGSGIDSADRWEGKLAPSTLTVDSESGQEMTDEEDFHSGEQSRDLTLEDLVNGYPDDN